MTNPLTVIDQEGLTAFLIVISVAVAILAVVWWVDRRNKG